MRTTVAWLLAGVLGLLGGGVGPTSADEPRNGDRPSRPHPSSQASLRYVAIGDSYTAGSGIPPETTGCLRSERSYPHRLAARLGARLVDVSCGGALTAHVEEAQWTGTATNPPQLEAVSPGTDLVTVGVGVNDLGFMTLLQQCQRVAWENPRGAPCRASYQGPGGDSLLAALPEVGRRVTRVLELVRARAPRAEVLLVGYPQLVPPTGGCPEAPFADGDYAYVEELMVAVDATLGSAVRGTGATYVSLLDASAGHDVCAGRRAWLLGAVDDPRAYVWHPFAKEQRAVARLIADELR